MGDAERAGIPPDYSIRNWDPSERPITFLKTVLDPSSLGKWIYAWEKDFHGADHPVADVAGELWLLLIKLNGKQKLAATYIPNLSSHKVPIVQDFIESADRIWGNVKDLLEDCESHVGHVIEKELGKTRSLLAARAVVDTVA